MAYVYKHIRLDTNEIFYIGVGKREITIVNGCEIYFKRAYTKSRRNSHWKNIIKKTNYSVEIIVKDIDYNDALSREIELIKSIGRKDLNTGTLVNMTDGGESTSNYIPTEEYKKKMSEKLKGKKRTKETIDKIVSFHKGRKRSEETKERMRISKIGKGIGNKNNLGNKHSEETRKKMSESHRRRLGNLGQK